MEQFDLLVVGDANPDVVLIGEHIEARFGQAETLADESVLTLGGSAAIAASGAAQLGLRTAFTGFVGDDFFGRFVMDALEERGIDTSGCTVAPDEATGVTIVLSRADDRASITSPGCTFSLRAADVGDSSLESTRHVHTSMYFHFSDLAPDLASLFETAKAHGAGTSLDPHGDPSGLWDSGIRDVLRSVDVFLPNEEEACGIAGVDDSAEAARILCSAGAGVVAVKRGARGALASAGEKMIEVPAPDGVAVVDATGAGDSFDAGFIAGHLKGWPLDQCLELAVACGSLSTRAVGGVDAQPSMAEAIEMIEMSEAGRTDR